MSGKREERERSAELMPSFVELFDVFIYKRSTYYWVLKGGPMVLVGDTFVHVEGLGGVVVDAGERELVSVG
jgi:hypothetical protein